MISETVFCEDSKNTTLHSEVSDQHAYILIHTSDLVWHALPMQLKERMCMLKNRNHL